MNPVAAVRRRLEALPRLVTLPPAEIADLFRVQRVLVAAWWAVRRRPRGALLAVVHSGDAAARPPLDEAQIERMLTAVDRVSRLGLFTPTCLVRAIALESLVRRYAAGTAVVRVGVLRNLQELLAHAWVELDGRVIGDDPAFVKQFTPLHDFSALAR